MIIRCGDKMCGIALDEFPEMPSTDRLPCPSCGSLRRSFDVVCEEFMVVSDLGIGLDQRRPGWGGPVYRSIDRIELFRKTGELRRVERIIDRSDPDPANRRYFERITDVATGELVQPVTDELLSEHQGHGTARHQPAAGQPLDGLYRPAPLA